jgi:hypothetical protein
MRRCRWERERGGGGGIDRIGIGEGGGGGGGGGGGANPCASLLCLPCFCIGPKQPRTAGGARCDSGEGPAATIRGQNHPYHPAQRIAHEASAVRTLNVPCLTPCTACRYKVAGSLSANRHFGGSGVRASYKYGYELPRQLCGCSRCSFG